uniref:RING finger protein n=1 Tax=Mycena chlorophos TaxID=658473 RepID=A0ABQ0LUR6_MYCCL|nr:RING finger protein [Mycena chlorophos]
MTSPLLLFVLFFLPSTPSALWAKRLPPSSPSSPSKLELAALNANHDALDKYSKRPDCFRRVAARIRLRCEDLETDEDERVSAAIAMTVCEVATATHYSLPLECVSFAVDAEPPRNLNHGECVDALSRSAQFWSSYSGYLREVPQLCFAFRRWNDIDTARDIYRNSTMEASKLMHWILTRSSLEEQALAAWEMKLDELERNTRRLDDISNLLNGVLDIAAPRMEAELIRILHLFREELVRSQQNVQSQNARMIDLFGTELQLVTHQHVMSLSAIGTALQLQLDETFNASLASFAMDAQETLHLTLVTREHLKHIALYMNSMEQNITRLSERISASAVLLEQSSQDIQTIREAQDVAAESASKLSMTLERLNDATHDSLDKLNSSASQIIGNLTTPHFPRFELIRLAQLFVPTTSFVASFHDLRVFPLLSAAFAFGLYLLRATVCVLKVPLAIVRKYRAPWPPPRNESESQSPARAKGRSTESRCSQTWAVDQDLRSIQDEKPLVALGRNVKVAQEEEVCWLFLQKRCHYGRQCRYRHTITPQTPAPLRESNSAPFQHPLPPRHTPNLPPRLMPKVKLPPSEYLSDAYKSQAFSMTLSEHDSGPPVVRLRPTSRPFLPSTRLPQTNSFRTNMFDETLRNVEQTEPWGVATTEKAWEATCKVVDETPIWDPRTDDKLWVDASLSSDDSSTDTSSTRAESFSSPRYLQPRRTFPRANPQETCRNWLRNACRNGPNCRYLHGYPASAPSIVPPAQPPPETAQVEPPIVLTMHDHTRVTVGVGFEISDVTTGVENPWVVLGNIPRQTKAPAIRKLLDAHGIVEDIKMPTTTTGKDAMVVKARFSSNAEAVRATAALDGTTFLHSTISARIPVNSRSGTVSISDTSLRIQWEAPQRVAYGGYASLDEAKKVIAAAKTTPCGDYMVQAAVYEGVPSVGIVTVKFTSLPPDATEQLLHRLGPPPGDVMWERANYLSLQPALDGIRVLLRGQDGFRDLEVLPPPYSNGLIRAWARFSSSNGARRAADFIHGRKPPFTGKKKIYARHIQSLEYSLPVDEYTKHAALIERLRIATLGGHAQNVNVRHLSPQLAQIKLSSESVQELGLLKSEFEKILRGEVLREDGVGVWDSFFARDAGVAFLRQVENSTGARIEVDDVRRSVKLFGIPATRAAARKAVLKQLGDLKGQQRRSIRILGQAFNVFMAMHFTPLCRKFGAENVLVDLWEGRVTFHGGDELYTAGTEAIHQAQQSVSGSRNLTGCPVCLNKYVSPVTLSACRHTWCRACLSQYLLASIDNRHFPLKCLGDGGKCNIPISLTSAKQVLAPHEFNMVVDAALSSYVSTHAKELHHCPSPDCLQIYRTGPRGTVVQCPACLVRICAFCHVEAHDGFSCAEQDAGSRLFKEWVAEHDVKNCPGCDVPIERDEGCHHVTCSQCRTHICWQCLRTFPNGDGIYQHMRAEHGGIGLAEFDAQ